MATRRSKALRKKSQKVVKKSIRKLATSNASTRAGIKVAKRAAGKITVASKEIATKALTARERLVNQTSIGSALTQIPTVGASQTLQDKAATTEKALLEAKRETEELKSTVKQNIEQRKKEYETRGRIERERIQQEAEIKNTQRELTRTLKERNEAKEREATLLRLNTELAKGNNSIKLSERELEIQTQEQQLYAVKHIQDEQRFKIESNVLMAKAKRLEDETKDIKTKNKADAEILASDEYKNTLDTLKTNYINHEIEKEKLELNEKNIAMKREADRNKAKSEILTSNTYGIKRMGVMLQYKANAEKLEREIIDNDIKIKQTEIDQIAYDTKLDRYKKAAANKARSDGDVIESKERLNAIKKYIDDGEIPVVEGENMTEAQKAFDEYGKNMNQIYRNDQIQSDTRANIDSYELRLKAMNDTKIDATKVQIMNQQDDYKASVYKRLDESDQDAKVYLENNPHLSAPLLTEPEILKLPPDQQAAATRVNRDLMTLKQSNLDMYNGLGRVNAYNKIIQDQIAAEKEHRENENKMLKYESRHTYKRKVLTDTYALERENETLTTRNEELTNTVAEDTDRNAKIKAYEAAKIKNESLKELNNLSIGRQKYEAEKAYYDASTKALETDEIRQAQIDIANRKALADIRKTKQEELAKVLNEVRDNSSDAQAIQNDMAYLIGNDEMRTKLTDQINDFNAKLTEEQKKEAQEMEQKRIGKFVDVVNGYVKNIEEYHKLHKTIEAYYKSNPSALKIFDKANVKGQSYSNVVAVWIDYLNYLGNTYLDTVKIRRDKILKAEMNNDGMYHISENNTKPTLLTNAKLDVHEQFGSYYHEFP